MGKRPVSLDRQNAERLAIQALSFIAVDPERLSHFLTSTGIGPEQIRAAAQETHFLTGVLDHLAADEHLLLSFATDAGIDPIEVAAAFRALGGRSEMP